MPTHLSIVGRRRQAKPLRSLLQLLLGGRGISCGRGDGQAKTLRPPPRLLGFRQGSLLGGSGRGLGRARLLRCLRRRLSRR